MLCRVRKLKDDMDGADKSVQDAEVCIKKLENEKAEKQKDYDLLGKKYDLILFICRD